MEELINILDQQFYYSNVEELLEGCSRFGKCAVVIDEDDLIIFLKKGMYMIGEKIDNIIVISENLNKVVALLQGKEVLLTSASDFKEAIRFSIMTTEISKDIVCVSKESEVSKIIQSVAL